MSDRPCGCALQCYDTVTIEHRKKLFTGFWGLGSFDIQNAYLCGCVKVLPVKRHYRSDSKRGNTRVYYVNNGEKSISLQESIHGHSWSVKWSSDTNSSWSGRAKSSKTRQTWM